MDRVSKQIIVMRKSFIINGKKVTPRKGKYIAQGAHASIGVLLNHKWHWWIALMWNFLTNPAMRDWLKGRFTKICVCVETEEELLAVYNKAKAQGLICSLITDAGNTEFDGIPTITCCAIGPAWAEDLHQITGKLELF